MAKTYSEKLKDPRWQKKRLEIFEKANWKCELCSDSETELHIHHLEYFGEPWDQSNDKLKCLCKDCHLMAEKYITDMHLSTTVKKVKRETGVGFIVFYKTSTVVSSLTIDGVFDFISFAPKSEILKDMYLHNQSI